MSNTVLNVEEIRKGDVGEVVVLINGMVGMKEEVLRRRIRDGPTRTSQMTKSSGIEVDGSLSKVGTVFSHKSTLSRSINESRGRSRRADGWHC